MSDHRDDLPSGEFDYVRVTHQLPSDRKRKPTRTEINALYKLGRVLATEPNRLLDAVLEIAIELCGPGSSGMSFLDLNPRGETIFQWKRVAGESRECVGRITHGKFSPFQVTLDHGCPELFAFPDCYFAPLSEIGIPVMQLLVAPLHIDGEKSGVLWIASHKEGMEFDSEHVQIMTGLAEFARCALRLLRSLHNEQQARQETECEIGKRRHAESDLVGQAIVEVALMQDLKHQAHLLASASEVRSDAVRTSTLALHERSSPWGSRTGVRLWIGPGGGSSGCPRGPVTLRGCSCGAGRGFALADPLRSVSSACGVRCWCPRSARDWPGRSWPRCPGHAGVPARRVPGRAAGREVRRLAGRSAAAILASRAGAAGAGGWRRARCRCFCGF